MQIPLTHVPEQKNLNDLNKTCTKLGGPTAEPTAGWGLLREGYPATKNVKLIKKFGLIFKK